MQGQFFVTWMYLDSRDQVVAFRCIWVHVLCENLLGRFLKRKEADPRVSHSPHIALKYMRSCEICAGNIVGWSSQKWQKN